MKPQCPQERGIGKYTIFVQVKFCTFLLATFFSVCFAFAFGQKKKDLSFGYPPGVGFRSYSVYEPSSYVSGAPIKLMIGFHGNSSGIWSAKTWRDTLVDLAESKGFLLVCPDGGSDGKFEEATDFGFVETLIDSILSWYAIDSSGRYAIGYDEGGKTVYEFGLNYNDLFRGFIPIAAVIDGTGFVEDVIHKAKCKNFYIVHGDQDSPNKRYHPIKEALTDHHARVNTILMASIGHTYNFPGRATTLSNAFNYIDSADCDFSGIQNSGISQFRLRSNYLLPGHPLIIEMDQTLNESNARISIADISGRILSAGIQITHNQITIELPILPSGIYFIGVHLNHTFFNSSFVIQ